MGVGVVDEDVGGVGDVLDEVGGTGVVVEAKEDDEELDADIDVEDEEGREEEDGRVDEDTVSTLLDDDDGSPDGVVADDIDSQNQGPE